MKYVREYTTEHSGSEKFLTYQDPAALFDEYQIEKTDIWYIAGTMLNIKCSNELSYAVIGYYRRPVVTATEFSSWIATEQPYAIIEEACSYLFQIIGHEEAAANFKRLAMEQRLLLIETYLEAESR